MTKKEAKAFKKRWLVVNQFEEAELRNTFFEAKFPQTTALMASAHLFERDPAEEAEIAEVRARWRLLRKLYGV
jgi:hypothetical protein